MYLGIDVGGTKTLVGSLTNEGVITQWHKFPTPEKYADFLPALKEVLHTLEAKDFRAIGIAAPGLIDREHGIFKAGGNIKWRNVHLQTDLARMMHTPVVLENDVNAAAVSGKTTERHVRIGSLHRTWHRHWHWRHHQL